MTGYYEWEVHLTYPFDDSRGDETTEIVKASTRESAIEQAKEESGWSDADAYPVYRLGAITDEHDVQEHPTPECPECGGTRTRPLDDNIAVCFDCNIGWRGDFDLE